ncbi:MAG TPA: SDR family oxidoreductase [Polyangiaceae bacterium]|nr:SDR family oxidoreductase [Polyangiaceae bacterium]
MTTKELEGMVAVVTGVGRRASIGAAVARELAGAGAKLMLLYQRGYDTAQAWGSDPAMPALLLEELAPSTEAYAEEVDLAEPGGANEVFTEVQRRFGFAQILVNNACHWESGDLAATDAAQLDRHYAVNTRAPVLLCREFVRQLPRGAAGRIVNVTSGQGHAPMPGEVAYAVTKASLDALTLTLAAELASRAITVNAVDPGPTDTGWMTDNVRAALIEASPSKTLATPRDTARLVRMLVSDRASDATGQILRVRPAPDDDGRASG